METRGIEHMSRSRPILSRDTQTNITQVLLGLSEHAMKMELGDMVGNWSLNMTTPTPGLSGLTLAEERHLSLLDKWLSGVISNVIVVLGLIGNFLTIIILRQRAMRSSTNYYLSALAFWDSVVLLCTALMINIPAVPDMEIYNVRVRPYVIGYVYPVALTAQTVTIWLTMSFTVERYIAVCHPLKAATMCTLSRAKKVIIGVSISSTLYNLPRWFEYKVGPAPGSIDNSTVQHNPTDLLKNSVYVQIYYSWLYVPIMCIVPLLVLSVLNTFLVMAVRRSQKQRKDMNVKQSRENNVTIMLTSVVVLFIICQVPALVYNFAYAIDQKTVISAFSYQILSRLRNFLVNLNSACNFLLYCALGQKFRRMFLHTFCRKCAGENYVPMMSGTYQSNALTAPHLRRHNNNSTTVKHKLHAEVVYLNHSTSTTQTILTRSSQESNILKSDLLLTANPARPNRSERAVCTYKVPSEHKRKVVHNKNFEGAATESDDDLVFEQLLPDAEKELCVYYKLDSLGQG